MTIPSSSLVVNPVPTVAHTRCQGSQTELEAGPAFSSQIWVCEQVETPSHPLKHAGAKMGILLIRTPSCVASSGQALI